MFQRINRYIPGSVYIYIYVCVCIHIYIYIYTHIYLWNRQARPRKWLCTQGGRYFNQEGRRVPKEVPVASRNKQVSFYFFIGVVF